MRIREWVRRARRMGVVPALLALAGAMHAQGVAQPAPLQPAFPGGEASGLGGTVAALLAAPKVSSAHWGIAVTALDGTPLYGLHEAQLFRPASNAKLFTTSAAMALLGPEKTFTTSMYGRLDATGTVNGDLTLRGGGDAAFGTDDLPYREPDEQRAGEQSATPPQSLADLSAMVDALVARGVKRVTGNIVGDDTEFVWEPYPEGWSTEDLAWGYGAPASALDLGDNELRLTVTPGVVNARQEQAASVTLDQNGTAYYTLAGHVDTVSAALPSQVRMEREQQSRTLRVEGQMASDAAPEVEHVAVDEPAAYAAEVLRTMLVERGIAVEGSWRAQHQTAHASFGFAGPGTAIDPCDALTVAGGACAGSCAMYFPAGAAMLSSHVSPPLIEDITYMLKVSQNLHAETLLHDLGRRVTCGDGSEGSGAALVRAWLVHEGIDAGDFFFYDGSGLSTKDLVTPRATARLLAYDARQPWFAEWKAALPVGGVDGTLEHRFREAPLKGHVFAKTGTLGETAALSGYVVCASGRTVIFSIFADAHLPDDPEVRETIDRIVAAIAAAE